MKVSDSATRLRVMIEKAIEDHIITTEEFDEILNLVHEDGHIDRHERALLSTLQEMIENKEVKFSNLS